MLVGFRAWGADDHDTRVSDLGPLSSLTALQSLDCRFNRKPTDATRCLTCFRDRTVDGPMADMSQVETG
jgi:hypothetical protein